MSVGCYATQSDSICNNYDPFNETLTSTQCENAAASFSMECITGVYCGYSFVQSKTNMTIEACLQICMSNSFIYVGLRK